MKLICIFVTRGLKRHIWCKLNIKFENWCHSTLIFISFAIVHVVSISIGPPFLKSCVTPLHSNVFAGQSLILPTIKPIKIYTFRILYTYYAWVLRLWTKDIDLRGRSRGGDKRTNGQTEETDKRRREGQKFFFFKTPPPPLFRGWENPPPPPPHPLSEGLDPPLDLTPESQIRTNDFEFYFLFLENHIKAR